MTSEPVPDRPVGRRGARIGHDGVVSIPDFGPALDRGSLRERLADVIRRDIVNGVFGPGEQLRTETLVARYQVSNTPVREALSLLASEGLVELRTNRGARVALVTKADAVSLLQVAGMLNVAAYEAGVPRLTEAQVATLTAISDQVVAAEAAGDIATAMAAAHDIHHLVLAAGGNQELTRILDQLQPRIDRLVRRLYVTDGSAARAGIDLTDADIDHLAIVRAIEEGRREEAVDLVRRAWAAFVTAVEAAPESAFDLV
jgi:DNA-binding GntR family transcriptional regulator